MNVKLLSEHHLEFLSLTGGCTGSYESTLFKMPHCRKSHVTARMFYLLSSEFLTGLWMADLTITQMFLENVEESQRGIVNGVQTSLNQLMDILKNIMVVVAPHPEVFGILILISFGFIIIAWMFYAKYSYSVRGHLFHFDKIRKCDCGDARNNNVPTEIEA